MTAIKRLGELSERKGAASEEKTGLLKY